MDDILERLITERDEIRATFDPMRERLARLETAIAALQGHSVNAQRDEGRKRRKNVRGTVLDVLGRAGDTGVTVSDILEEAAASGNELEKTSVSTLLSTMKRSGIVIAQDGKYMMAPEGTEPEPPSGRGRKKKEPAE